MQRLSNAVVLLTIPALLAACAASSDKYPTLEIREAERVTGTFDVPSSVKPSPLQESVAISLPEIETAARASHAKFIGTAPATRSAIDAAQGTDYDSNDWAVAQIALADLESHRSDTAIALAELDLLFAQSTLRFEQRQAIAAAIVVVEELVTEEDLVLSQLRAAIAQ